MKGYISNDEWFHHLLFQDPDFIIASDELLEKLRQKYTVPPNPEPTEDKQLQKRYEDWTTITIAEQRGDEEMNSFCSLYRVSCAAWQLHIVAFNDPHKDTVLPRFTGHTTYNPSPVNRISLTMRPDITYREFVKLWANIANVQELHSLKPGKRQRSNDDPELIYAIFKARLAGKTFPTIHNEYMATGLPMYGKKPKAWFVDEDSFEEYYRKYMPPRTS